MKSVDLTFLYNGLNCRLVRTDRKTVAIICTPEGEVEIRSPKNTPETVIKRLIDQNRPWIDERLTAIRDAQKDLLCTEDSIRLLGRWWEIREGDRHDFGDSWIMIPKNAENRKRAIDKSCRMLAKKVFGERVAYYAPLLGVKPSSVSVGWGITRKWGSCDGLNNLYFTWKALFCEARDVDYLVVHELSHIRYHNHGPRFWKKVSLFFPDYQECRARMAKMSETVRVQGWVNY